MKSNFNFKKRAGKDLEKSNYKRPIWELTGKKNKKEIFSIVQAFVENNIVKLIFANGVKKFPHRILEKVKRNISGYMFFTPPDEDIREIFRYCFRNRKNWKTNKNIRKDAEVIFDSDEYEKYFS